MSGRSKVRRTGAAVVVGHASPVRSGSSSVRVAFPIAFALLAACLGPQTEPIGRAVGELDELPQAWDEGRVVDPNGHMGWTRGVFAVGPDGEASYDVPLWSPPGRAGIEPGLALHYSSRRGETSVGVGWSITGLSSITRCGRTRTIDGAQLGSVRWDQQVYCLEGTRLIPIDGSHFRPLQNGTERIGFEGDVTNPTSFLVEHDNGIRYRYEQRVEATACAPDGGGGTGVVPLQTQVTYAWLLTRVEDLAGNFMTVDYQQVTHEESATDTPIGALVAAGCAPVEWVPQRMSYTGGPTSAPRRSVAFTYAMVQGAPASVRMVSGEVACAFGQEPGCRSDSTRPVGIATAITRYLSDVEMYGPDASAPAARHYVVRGTTSASTRQREVLSIQECAGIHCRAALMFEYTDSGDLYGGRSPLGVQSAARLDTSSVMTSPLSVLSNVAHADFDGDGAEETYVYESQVSRIFRYVSSSNSIVTDSLSHPLRAATIPYDADGDGLADMATDDGVTGTGAPVSTRPILRVGAASENPEAPRFYVVAGTRTVAGTSSIQCPLQSDPAYLPTSDDGVNYTLPATGAGRALSLWDREGFGVPRLVAECSYMQPQLRRTRPHDDSHTTYVQDNAHTWWFGAGAPVHIRAGTFPPRSLETVFPFGQVSLDGSGRSTIIQASDDRLVALPAADGGSIGVLNLPTDGTWVFLDVNGDGLSDALDMRTWNLRMNMGGFYAPATVAFDAAHPEYSSLTRADLRTGDFNGDGRSDLAVLVPPVSGPVAMPARLDLFLWTGQRFTPARELVAGAVPSLPAGLHDEFHGGWPLTSVLDFDGDGMLDLQYAVAVPGDSLHVRLEMRRLFRRQPGLLTRVRRSGRDQVTATYTADHYRAGNCDDLAGTVSCAASVTTVARHTDELGLEYRHSYAGPRFDLRGAGWLGFVRHRVTEPTASADEIRYTDTYYQPPTAADVSASADGGRYLTTRLPRVSLHVAGDTRNGLTVTAAFVEYGPSTATEFPGTVYPMATIQAVHLRTWSDVATRTWHAPDEGDLAAVPDLAFTGFPSPPVSHLTRSTDRTFRYAPHGCGVPEEVLETRRGVGTATIALRTHADLDHWLLAIAERSSVTSTTEDGRSYTRTASFEYGGFTEPGGEPLGAGGNGLPHLLRTSTREPDDTTNLWQRTELERDSFGNVTRTTITDLTGDDPRTSQVFFDDDEHLFPRRVLNALGHESWIGVEPTLGMAVYSVDARGAVTTTTFDRFARPVSTSGHGTSARVSYSDFPSVCGGMLIDRRPASGGEDQSCVDQFGRALWHRVAGFDGPMTSRVTYDRLGRVQTAAPPQYGSGAPPRYETFTYDALDRIVQVDFAGDGGPPIRARYKGNIAQYTDRRGHTATVISDMGGRVSFEFDSPADAASGITYTKYTYGPFSNLREVRDQRGFTWSWRRDSHGRRLESHDPDAGDRFYRYDGFDRVSDEYDSTHLPFRTHYRYDALSRLVRIDSPGSETAPGDGVTIMQWDDAPIDGMPNATALGLPSRTIRARDGVMHALRYDPFGRVTHDTTTVGAADDLAMPTNVTGEQFDIGLAYDAAGRLDTITYPQIAAGIAPRTVTYGYDEDSGLPVSASLDGSPIWAADDYDGQARLVAETFGNGTHTEYTYGEHDPRGHVPWLERVRTTDATGHPLMDLSYTYDPNGNVLTRNEAVLGRNESYAYDGLSRLRSRTLTRPGFGRTTARFDYDDLGNLTNNGGVTQSYSSTQPHVLTGVGVTDVSTDDRGRITSAPGVSIDSYTDFDLPRSMSGPSQHALFVYDAAGERVRKIESGAITTYIHGLYERHSAGNLGQNHTWNVVVGGRTVAQVTQQGSSGTVTTSYLHADRNGSTALVTGALGTTVGAEHYAYTPFGLQQRLDGGSAPVERPGFTGDSDDPELSAVDMRGRIYAPSLGRFLTPDPIVSGRSRQAWNAYSYALNNPATLVDPSGFQVDSPGDGNWWEAAVAIVGQVANFLSGTSGSEGGGSGQACESYLGGCSATTTVTTSSAPVPQVTASPHLDSVGGTTSAPEGTSHQTVDAVGSAEGRHHIGERIADNLGTLVSSALDPHAPHSSGELAWQLIGGRQLEMAYGAVQGVATVAYYGTPWGLQEASDYAVHRVVDVYDAHVAGDDGPLDDLIGDIATAAVVVAATVLTGRIVGGALAADVAASDTGAVVRLAEGGSTAAAPGAMFEDVGRARLVRTLAQGESAALDAGSPDLAHELASLARAAGKEHALVQLASGEHAIVSGGVGGIDFAELEIQQLLAHTHPEGPLAAFFSEEDALFIRALGQQTSHLIALEPGGGWSLHLGVF